jgi:hypothetical protein
MAPTDSSSDQPLGMTVHSMPSPQDIAANAAHTRIGRWKMLLVLLVCAAPVVASYVTYYLVRPQARQNFGTLIDPQASLPEMQAVEMAGKPTSLRALKGQWLLISVAGGSCDAQCQHHLYMQRQLREGLGKEKDRVDWVWLLTDDTAIAPSLLPALATATVLRVSPAELQTWLRPEQGAAIQDHLYVVDPLGNWMMRFPARMDVDQAPKVKRDMERLLRASAFWDTPGR